MPPDERPSSVTLGLGYAKRWEKIRRTIPDSLASDQEIGFRDAVLGICGLYLAAFDSTEKGAATARAIQKPAGKQPAPLDSFARHLLAAAAIWPSVRGLHDDHLGPLSDHLGLRSEFGVYLDALAKDAQRRLAQLRKLKSEKPMPDREMFVRSIAKKCRAAGLNPTGHGRAYEEGSAPTWFQEFIAAINDQFLGRQGWGDADADKRALFADVTKVLGGDRKAGRART